MTGIALYNTLRKIPLVSDNEAKEAVADIANSKQVATKSDINELKAETKSDINELKAETKLDIKDMATKSDIAEVKADIAEVRVEIADVKTELKADIADIKYQKCQRYAETSIRIKPHSALSYPSD